MASLPATLAPNYKDRRGWLIAFGVFEFLIAGCLLLMAVSMAVILPSIPMPSGQPPVPSGIFLVSAGFYALLAALFISVGIGSARARNWARITMIAVSALWLAFGILGMIISAVIMPLVLRQQAAIVQQRHPDAAPLSFGGGVLVFVIAIQATLMIVLPLIFLLFYVSRNVKATCQGSGVIASPALNIATPAALAQRPARTPPVPLIVLSVWYGLAALSVVGVFWLPIAIVFGVVIRGAAARLVILALAAAASFCAWSVYHRQIEGWWAAAAFSLFSLVSGLVTAVRLDLASFLAEVHQKMEMPEPSINVFKLFPGLMTFIMITGVILAVVQLGLLLYAKRYFQQKQQAS